MGRIEPTPDDQAPAQYRKGAYDARRQPFLLTPILVVIVIVAVMIGAFFHAH